MIDAVTDAVIDSAQTIAAIEMSHLTHRFGEYVAVDDLSLTVAAGSCFGLLGPNGAGKTTTIRVINTLLPAQQGDVRIFGLDVRAKPMATGDCSVTCPSSSRSRAP